MRINILLFKKIERFFANLLFKESCLYCKKDGNLICLSCIDNQKFPERDLPQNILAGFDYRDEIIKKLLISLKYYGKKNNAYILGQALYLRFLEEIAGMRTLSRGQKILIIPVPISKKDKNLEIIIKLFILLLVL